MKKHPKINSMIEIPIMVAVIIIGFEIPVYAPQGFYPLPVLKRDLGLVIGAFLITFPYWLSYK